jgi:ion channel POLLUX/CASTOR
MTQRHTPGARLRYNLDTMLSRGTGIVMAWLGLFSVALVVIAGAVIQVTGIEIDGRQPGFLEAVWLSLERTLDAGTGGSDSGTAFRIVSFLVTLGGIFVVTALIGLVATGIERKLEELRKGRSSVVETGYTLILGWSPKIYTILQELAVANASKRDACVVIMAPRDKVTMDDDIRSRAGDLQTTRVVCRTGEPSDPSDLLIVDPLNASSVIVLRPDGELSPDASVVCSILALLRIDPGLARTRVVAEFIDAETAMVISEVTGNKVLAVVSSNIISRIAAQVCRQPGLSAVFQDLLDFDGAELYFVEEPRLTGMTFGEAVHSYATSTVIGIRHPSGETSLAPPRQTVVESGDRMVLIAEDDSTVFFSEPIALDQMPAETLHPFPKPQVDRILIVGWNDLGPLILRELDAYVAIGSVVDVLADPTLVTGDPRIAPMKHLSVIRHNSDTASQRNLEALLRRHAYNRVVVLCYGGLRPADADARTLVTLLQLQGLLPETQPATMAVSVLSELLDVRHVELAMATSAQDFVVSERLTSLVLAQLADDPDRGTIFRDLLNSGGSDVSLQPATSYAPSGIELSFGTIVESALSHGHVAIGYRLSVGPGGVPQIIVNPAKTDRVRLTVEDQLVVIRSLPGGSPVGRVAAEALADSDGHPVRLQQQRELGFADATA